MHKIACVPHGSFSSDQPTARAHKGDTAGQDTTSRGSNNRSNSLQIGFYSISWKKQNRNYFVSDYNPEGTYK